MVKSFSQDAATAGPSSTFVKNAAVAMIMASETPGGIHPSASDSHLSARYIKFHLNRAMFLNFKRL